jgi:hypothetical protein
MEADDVYGHKLPKAARDLISLATLYLTFWWPKEQSAPRLDGPTTNRLRQLVELAEQLRSELFPSSRWLPEYQEDHRPRSAITKLQLALEQIGESDGQEFEFLLACLNSMVEIGDVILRYPQDMNYGQRDGGTWNMWVVLITLILQSHHLPTGVRAGDPYRVTKRGTSQSAPFVRLIKHLHDYVMVEGKKIHSDGALAKAIQKARESIDVSMVNTDKLDELLYGLLGVPGYKGLGEYFSDMEFLVYSVLNKRDVGIHQIGPGIDSPGPRPLILG